MKLQKIMVDGGFTCPNRDGKVGWGGCTFCRTDSFQPAYCQGSISQQIEAGKQFFAGKYPEMKYLVYFQSYTNTYATLPVLISRYEEALLAEDVVGLVIGTRPDCLKPEVLNYLSSLRHEGKEIIIELGIESFYDRTLQKINRGHTSQQAIEGIKRCAMEGLPVTIHLMIGLPGESEEEILQEAEIINQLPVSSIKIHQLQILKGTAIEREWQSSPTNFLSLTPQNYARLVAKLIQRLRKDIKIERMASSSPSALLIHPRWGLKPSQVEQMIEQELDSLQLR